MDASLKRVRTDHVDLYQCHRYDEETPLEETMQALTEIVGQGKARYIGFSEWPAERIEAAFQVPNVVRFVSSQPQYSLLWREPERAVIPVCRKHDISQVVWSPLAQGVLTGKYKPGARPPADSRAAHDSMGFYMEGWLSQRILRNVERLKPIAERAGVSLAQFALAWVLREPNVASAIVGATRPEQVEENARASGLEIDPTLFAEAEAVVGAVRS
jgi:aryl-alcohol dehydrogenase-like predicted oxidoreductase